jgi:hypothetical protein
MRINDVKVLKINERSKAKFILPCCGKGWS